MLQNTIRDKLAVGGLSAGARDWVVKALDPACTLKSHGIPDASACSVMRPEYTVQQTIPAPAVATATWDCIMFLPPGNVQTLMWAAGPAGTDFSSPTAPAGGVYGYIALESYVDYPGNTQWTYLDTTAAPPYPPWSETNLGSRGPTSVPLTFRHQYKSVTVDLIAAAVNNQGDVYASQYPTDFRLSKRPQIIGTGGLHPNPLMALKNEIALPMNEYDLTLSSRNPYVAKAVEGVYMPLRLMGPNQPFADVSYGGGAGSTISGSVLLPIYDRSVQHTQTFWPVQNDTGGQVGQPWINSMYQSATVTCDTGYDNTATGVIIWRGLSAGGGGGGFGASLMVKVIVGLEVCPRPTTADRIYAQPAAPYEPRALEAYYGIMGQLQPAYPARFNALGAILPVISTALSQLWPAVKAGGAAFLKQVMGEERAAERVPFDAPRRVAVREPVAKRSPSVASRVSRVSVKPRPRRRGKRALATTLR
jgi:hypothetical protein